MKIDHAQVMAHLCRMTKEAAGEATAPAAQQPIDANLGALLGAGAGAVGLPLIDYIRGRKQRMGTDALAGGLAGGALGFGLGYMNEKGWNPVEAAKEVSTGSYRGQTREDALKMLDEAKMNNPVVQKLSDATDVTAGGLIGGAAGMYGGHALGNRLGAIGVPANAGRTALSRWGGRAGGLAGAIGGYVVGNNIQRGIMGR